jgi:hypothetical protein
MQPNLKRSLLSRSQKTRDEPRITENTSLF